MAKYEIRRATTGNEDERAEAKRLSFLAALAKIFFDVAAILLGAGDHEGAEEYQKKGRDILRRM